MLGPDEIRLLIECIDDAAEMRKDGSPTSGLRAKLESAGSLFTLPEFKAYLAESDSFGDAVYFLSEERIAASRPV